MSWSFHLLNGDLNPAGPGGLAQVTGSQKLIQDLRCALLEPIGTDLMNPSFGSSLDGGVDPSTGASLPGFIGQQGTDFALLEIESEIRRVLAVYQSSQIDRMYADQQQTGQNSLSPGEVLQSVDSVVLQQADDRLVVSVMITAGDGTSIPIVQAVQ